MQDALQQLERKVQVEGATEENLRAFWRVVNRIKLERRVTDDVLERIVRLRDRVFEEKYPRFLSLRQGLTLAAVGTLFGAVLIWYALQSINAPVFLVASLLMLIGTHPWGHWIAGKIVGVNYEYFYLDGPLKIQPCLKIDYRDYLKASFDSRVIVHASGALATVLTALALPIVALTTGSLQIIVIAAVVIALVIATEAVSFMGFAAGDLKRARRERNLKELYMKQKKPR
jgi:hypothetical protein